jgi:hypothetical protein
MSNGSGWRIVVAIMVMGACGWLIYGAIVGGASAPERYHSKPQRPATVAAAPGGKADSPNARPGHPGPKDDAPKARPGHPGPKDGAPKARPGHPGAQDRPPAPVPPNAQRAVALLA